MSSTTNITIRIDKDIKLKAESLFSDLGMNISTAFNIFIKKCIREDRIPFEISRNPNFNTETIDAILEAEKLSDSPTSQSYSTMQSLLAALDSNHEEHNC